MAIAAKYGLNLFKSDTKQTFLNGDICEEEIFVRDQIGGWSMSHMGVRCS